MSNTYQLTKIDVAALRKADRLCICFDGMQPDRSRVEAIRELTDREREADPFAGTERRYLVPAGDAIGVAGYGYNGIMSSYLTREQTASVRAFAHIYVYRTQATEEATILDSLRAGDEVRFEFWAGCGTESLDAAGFAIDESRLYVTRGGKRLQYLLRYEVCQTGSPARMIRGLPQRVERAA